MVAYVPSGGIGLTYLVLFPPKVSRFPWDVFLEYSLFFLYSYLLKASGFYEWFISCRSIREGFPLKVSSFPEILK